MLKPDKFIKAQLNIERLTPFQWDGILRAMYTYAIHYHETKVNELNIPDVIKSVCEHKNKTKISWGISDAICDNCGERIKQTVL